MVLPLHRCFTVAPIETPKSESERAHIVVRQDVFFPLMSGLT